MIEQELYEHLLSNVTLVDGRVFANVFHQDTPKPALIYTVVSEVSKRSFSCGYDEIETDWVLHTYHEEYFENKKVKNEVKDALASFAKTVGDVVAEDAFDEQSGLFVQIIHFKTKEQ